MKGLATVTTRTIPPIFLVLLAVLLFGCGRTGDRPSLGSVSGRVTLDGQPLKDATVSFRPERGQISDGVTDADGRYELIYLRDIKGAIPGRHTVAITTATEQSPTEKLPARHNVRTELTADVKAGPNTFDFALHAK